MAPDKTISSRVMKGQISQKSRFTFLACCNEDGSHQLPCFLLEHLHPRDASRRRKRRNVVWSTRTTRKHRWPVLFLLTFLRSFNQRMVSKHNTKVVLLIDNCSTHGSYDPLPKLSNVEVLYLPANSFGKLQPLGHRYYNLCEDAIQTVSFWTCCGFSRRKH